MFSYSFSACSANVICSKCELNARLTEKIAELETRIRTLYSIKASEVFIESFSAPDASASLSPRQTPAEPSQQGEWITVRENSRKRKPPVHHQPPTHVSNRFSPLSNAPAEKLVERALVIGDSILRNVKIATPTTIVNCIPGARAADIEANLKVLAKGKSKSKFSRIIIHVGANDVRMRQSEITKLTIKSVCTLAKQMSQSVTFSGPTPMRRGDEIYSRLTSLNRWLSEWCPSNNVGYINNWHAFRGRPGLLKRDGIHPTWEGAALLSRNLANSLKHC